MGALTPEPEEALEAAVEGVQELEAEWEAEWEAEREREGVRQPGVARPRAADLGRVGAALSLPLDADAPAWAVTRSSSPAHWPCSLRAAVGPPRTDGCGE